MDGWMGVFLALLVSAVVMMEMVGLGSILLVLLVLTWGVDAEEEGVEMVNQR